MSQTNSYSRHSTLMQVAQLYHEQNLTQAAIAGRLGMSRHQVGRLLAEAVQVGIVRIQVIHTGMSETRLSEKLRERYGLVAAVVPSTGGREDSAGVLSMVAQAAAAYVQSITPLPDVIGVSWGRTMAEVAQWIQPGSMPGVYVVQVNGGLSRTSMPTSAVQIAGLIARAGDREPILLPVPAILAKPATRKLLEDDASVAPVLLMAKAAPVVLFGLGALSASSVLVQSGYIDNRTEQRLRARGAVGDVLGRYLTSDGESADPELEERTLGLSVDDLRSKRLSIAVAVGEAKHGIMLAGLRGGVFNVLVTDQRSAEKLLSDGE